MAVHVQFGKGRHGADAKVRKAVEDHYADYEGVIEVELFWTGGGYQIMSADLTVPQQGLPLMKDIKGEVRTVILCSGERVIQ